MQQNVKPFYSGRQLILLLLEGHFQSLHALLSRLTGLIVAPDLKEHSQGNETRPGLAAGIPHCCALLSPTYHQPHTEFALRQEILGTYRLRVFCPRAAKKNFESACPAAGLPFFQAVSAEKK